MNPGGKPIRTTSKQLTRQKKIETLTHELVTVDEKRDARLKPDVKEMLNLIDNDSIFYHEIVLFFHKYREKRMKETGTAV